MRILFGKDEQLILKELEKKLQYFSIFGDFIWMKSKSKKLTESSKILMVER